MSSMAATFDPIKNGQKEDYIAVWTTVEGAMKIHVIGYKSKSVITEYSLTPETVTKFIEAIPTIFDSTKCKAFLFNIYKFEPLPTEYPHIINLCYTIRFKLDEMKAKYYFYSDRSLFLSGLLISAKLSNPSKGDTILFLLAKSENIFVNEYKFGEIGYEKIRDINVTVTEKESFADIRANILAGTKPKNIIVFGTDISTMPIMKKLKKNIFNQEKLIFRDKKTVTAESIQYSLKISKGLLDPSYTKYHVIPKCAKKLCVSSCLGSPFITVEVGDKLPYEFEEYAFRSCNVIVITAFDNDGEDERIICETVHNNQTRHRSKITFRVDSQNFPYLCVKPVLIDLIQELPARLDVNLTKKIPVIVFCDNFSVIVAQKKDEEAYSFLEEWNGLCGHDASIYVDGERREFGWKAKDLKYVSPASGVIDILTLMSKAVEDLEMEPALGRDPETTLCKFMTELIKEHFEAIRKATGADVEEVAFWNLLNFEEDAFYRYKTRLMESFKPLRIICHLLKLEVPE